MKDLERFSITNYRIGEICICGKRKSSGSKRCRDCNKKGRNSNVSRWRCNCH